MVSDTIIVWSRFICVSLIAMPKARLLMRQKERFEDGSVLEVVIWKLPASDPERPHSLKYSLYFGRGDRRLVGYDNERGKGDHRHYGDHEAPYRSVSLVRLLQDFYEDLARERGLP